MSPAPEPDPMSQRTTRTVLATALALLLLAAAPGRAQEERSLDEVIASLGGPADGDCQSAAQELATRGVGAGDRVCEALQGSLLAMVELVELGETRMIPAFLAALDHPIVEVRAAGARALGVFRDQRALEPLIAALGDPSAAVRSSAAEALARLGDPSAVSALTALAADADRAVRRSAIDALDRLEAPLAGLIRDALRGDEDALEVIVDERQLGAVAPFTQTLADEAEDPDARAAAAAGLARLIGEEAIDELIACLGYSVTRLRRACSDSLEDLGLGWSRLVVEALEGSEEAMEELAREDDPRVLDPLLASLDHTVPGVRIAAARTLAVRADPASFEALMEAFWEGSVAERAAVTEALEAIDRQRFLAALNDNLDQLRTENKIHTATALGQLGETAALDELFVLLDNEDVAVRTSAAAALGVLADPRAVDPLVEALDDPDPGVREAVATALGALGDKRAIGPMIEAMGDRDPVVRRKLSESLTALGDTAGRRLYLALEDNVNAISALASNQRPRFVQPLVDAYESSHIQTRRAALHALSVMGPGRAAKLMTEALQESDLRLRLIAITTLERIGDERALEPLLALARDVRVEIRIAAAMAIAAIGGPGVDDALLAALQDREARMREIGAWHAGRIRDTRAEQRLIELLTDPVDRVRRAACWALGRLGSEEAVPVLARRLRDREVDVRRAAVWALAEIGGQQAVDALVGGVDDSEPLVVEEIRKALDAAGEPLGALILDAVGGSRQAREAVMRSGDPRAIEPLTSLARWGTGSERRAAIRTLSAFDTPEAKKEMVRAVRSWNPLEAAVGAGAIVRSDLPAGDKATALLSGLAGPVGMLYLPIAALGVALLVKRLRQPPMY
jgi:HEAT repeat protein